MINVLGIGVSSAGGAWRLRRVCAHLETGELTIVVSADRQTRMALLDAVTARQIPTEGRVWIDGNPVMPETVGLVRARVGEVDLHGPLADNRSLLWNVLLVPGQRPQALLTWLRLAARGVRGPALKALDSVGLERQAYERVGGLDPGPAAGCSWRAHWRGGRGRWSSGRSTRGSRSPTPPTCWGCYGPWRAASG